MYADTDLDDSGDEHSAQPLSLGAPRQGVVAERWGITSSPDASSSAPPSSNALPPTDSAQQPASSTQWQAHWLELRIHALKQQQQRYELRLQKLQQQQDRQGAALPSLLVPPAPQAEAPLPVALQQAAGPLAVPHQPQAVQDSDQQPSSAAAPANQAPAPESTQQARAQPLVVQEPTAASLIPEQTQGQHQQPPAVCEPRYKHRHARHPVPGLSMPELARHPFFCQHRASGSDNTAEQPASQGELMPDDAIALRGCTACCINGPSAETNLKDSPCMYLAYYHVVSMHAYRGHDCAQQHDMLSSSVTHSSGNIDMLCDGQSILAWHLPSLIVLP